MLYNWCSIKHLREFAITVQTRKRIIKLQHLCKCPHSFRLLIPVASKSFILSRLEGYRGQIIFQLFYFLAVMFFFIIFNVKYTR